MSALASTPYPYFGSKRRIAPQIWERIGDPPRLIIPFAGSMSELLARPTRSPGAREIVNDKNGFITNFWRAVRSDALALIPYLEAPINEIELQAWNQRFVVQAESLADSLRADPAWFCTKTAGWWAWGQCLWIGEGWTSSTYMSRPMVSNDQGLGRFRRRRAELASYLQHLRQRVSEVDILCGDWARCVSAGVLTLSRSGPVGIILDPPYSHQMRRRCYSVEEDVAADVRKWCMGNGDNPRLRIALCGLRGEHDELEELGWSVLDWRTGGGDEQDGLFPNQSGGEHHGTNLVFSCMYQRQTAVAAFVGPR